MNLFKSKSNIVIAAIITTLFIACSPQVYNIATWVNQDKLVKENGYKKIYLLSLLNNPANNGILERDFANEANKRGIVTVLNSAVIASSFDKKILDQEQTLAKAIELGCDAICTIGLLDVKSESRYVPGENNYYQPYANYGYYQQFPGYYNNYYYQTTNNPGYYVEDKTYYIECNLFDAVTKELLFSIQSKTYNPTDIDDICRAYTKEIFSTLQQKGVIKPIGSKKK